MLNNVIPDSSVVRHRSTPVLFDDPTGNRYFILMWYFTPLRYVCKAHTQSLYTMDTLWWAVGGGVWAVGGGGVCGIN